MNIAPPLFMLAVALRDCGITAIGSGVTITGNSATIAAAGNYRLSGSKSNRQSKPCAQPRAADTLRLGQQIGGTMSQGGNPPGQGNPPGRGFTQPLACPPTVDQSPRLSPTAPGPAAAPAAADRKSSKLLWIGLGCGGLLFVALIVAAGIAVYAAKQRFDVLQGQLAAARKASFEPPSALSGSCKLAYDCCIKITTAASDPVLAIQCEAFKTPGHTDAECVGVLEGYAKVAQTRGLFCR